MKIILISFFLSFLLKSQDPSFYGEWETKKVPGFMKRYAVEKAVIKIYNNKFLDASFRDLENKEVLGFESKIHMKKDSIVYLSQESYSFGPPNGTALRLIQANQIAFMGMVLKKTKSNIKLIKRKLTRPRLNKTYKKILIKNAQIVDVVGQKILKEKDILIVGGKIQKIENSIEDTDAKYIDLKGKYLMPGLWDMHTHFKFRESPELTMPLFIASGVTNIRLMSAELSGRLQIEQLNTWDQEIRNGKLLGPRIIEQSSFKIYGPKRRDRLKPSFFSPGTEEEAKKLVQYIYKNKYDAIKMYSKLNSEVYHTILKEAGKKSIPVVGHVPSSIYALDAINAGQKSIEHGHFFIQSSFTGSEEMAHNFDEYYKGNQKKKPKSPGTKILDLQDKRIFSKIVTAMKEKETWFCPTHITRKFDAYAGIDAFKNDPRLKYIPRRLLNNKWLREVRETGKSKKFRNGYYKSYYELALNYTYLAYKSGVNIIAGTDANDSFCFPGSGIVDELKEFVKAGFSPAEAIQTATINPARYMNLENDYGSVDLSKYADLIVLEKNPFKNIENLKDISYLIYQGSIYSSKDLENLLKIVEKNVLELNRR